jgi:hypothetical protein
MFWREYLGRFLFRAGEVHGEITGGIRRTDVLSRG